MNRSAIYVRVSYSEQVHGYSLDTQESACRDYCTRNGWEIASVYREEGESAKTTDRPELQKMLVDVTRKGAGVGFVVVYDLSRLARDTFDHLAIQRHLEQHGIRLRAASQNLEDSPEGKFVSTVLSATNELDNALRRRKTMAGMREALARGRWPWVAPIGYRNRRSEDGREKWVEPDPEVAPLLRWAFEQAATGCRSKDEIRAELASRGLDVPRETFYRTMRNPFYAGRVVSPRWSVDSPGAHEPLIPLAIFLAAAQAVRERRSYVTGQSEAFPFRAHVRCAGCGRGLAGYMARGKSGRRWPYYRCQPCRSNVAANALQERFTALLGRLTVTPGVLIALELIVADVVAQRAGRQGERAELANRRLAAERQKRERVLELALAGTIPETDCRRKLAECDRKLAGLELEASAAASPAVSFKPALAVARELLGNPIGAWRTLPSDRRPAWLRGVFPSGLAWEPSGDFRTPEKCLIYLPLQPKSGPVVAVGTPPEADLEPVWAWLESLARFPALLSAVPS